MFGIGYILGLTTGLQSRNSYCGPLTPNDETISRKRKILDYLACHPQSTVGEVAKGINEEYRLVSGSMIAMYAKNQIKRKLDEEENKYRYFF